jgi:hypothetical protein
MYNTANVMNTFEAVNSRLVGTTGCVSKDMGLSSGLPRDKNAAL